MSKRVEPILVLIQEIIILPIIEWIVAEGVLVIVRVKYNEPKLNQENGSTIRGIPRD
jgi:hypothetical protein